MNTDTTPNRSEFIPILILLLSFALLLFVLLVSSPSPTPRITIRNVNQVREILRFDSGEKGYPPRQLALSPDAKQLLVTTGYRNEFWQLSHQTEQIMDLKQSGGYSPAVFFREGKATTAFIDWRHNLNFQEMSSGTTLQRFDGLNGGADWSLSSDGEWLASTRDQLTLNLTNIETGEQRLSIRLPDGYHFRRTNATLSADGKVLATSLIHGEVLSFDLFLWDAMTGALIKNLGNFSNEDGFPSGLAFSHDGTRLAVGGVIQRNQRLISYFQLWDIPSGSVLAAWTGGTTSVTIDQIAFTSDDQHLMVEGSGQVWLWDVDEFIQTGTPLVYLKGNGSTQLYGAAALNPDGRLMANGTPNGGIAVYAVNSGQLLTTLKGHKGRITDLAFSDDGRLLVSSSSDRTVRLWSVGGYNTYLPPIRTTSPNTLPTLAVTPTTPG